MSDDPFPSYFFSKAPLRERVDLIDLKNSQNGFYWMLTVDNDLRSSEQKGTVLAPYEDNDTEMLDCCDLEDNYEINPTKSGKFITSFYVPTLLHSVIIGPRGSKLRELQNTTSTLIKVPKPDEEPIVKITGSSERSVASARTQIALLVLSRRERLSITHFVSIPVISDNIRHNFAKFREEILIKGPSTRGVDETIFQKVDKFHLTIVTLALLDEKEIEETKQLLNRCQNNIQKIFAGKRPKIVLKGVEIMNDDPSEVDVLYGKVTLDSREDAECLQQAADEILETFYRNGLVKRQYDGVKLHVTLMNSLFRKTDGFQKNSQGTKRESFDATYILDKYRDYYFGKTSLEKIHLSVRFTTGQSGYYQSAASITICIIN